MRRARRWLLAAAASGVAALALAACGGDQTSGGSTVAQPVDPPPLRTTTTDGVPDSHAVEPVVGQSAPAAEGAPVEGESSAAPSSGPAPARRPRGGVILSGADQASFARLAASLGGAQGLAVSALGLGRKVEQAGTLRAAVA